MSEKEVNVFVFGSNLSGIHGAGSAEEAFKNHGAVWGEGVGFNGNSYAIPTKDYNVASTLSVEQITKYIDDFVAFAEENPDMTFNVVKVGCGLAGLGEDTIAPLFFDAPDNCNLPEGW